MSPEQGNEANPKRLPEESPRFLMAVLTSEFPGSVTDCVCWVGRGIPAGDEHIEVAFDAINEHSRILLAAPQIMEMAVESDEPFEVVRVASGLALMQKLSPAWSQEELERLSTEPGNASDLARYKEWLSEVDEYGLSKAELCSDASMQISVTLVEELPMSPGVYASDLPD